MLKIGLTGGIGCGKSLVAKFFEEEAIPIVSADQIAKDIVNNNQEVKARLVSEFGSDIYTSEGILDRKKVAAIVFNDARALQKINAIVHPFVIKQQEDELNEFENRGDVRIAGVEAALIYEAGAEKRFDLIIVVSAPQQDIFDRLKNRDGLTPEQIASRIQAQIPLAEKVKRADYVIENDGTIDELRTKVKKLVQELYSFSVRISY